MLNALIRLVALLAVVGLGSVRSAFADVWPRARSLDTGWTYYGSAAPEPPAVGGVPIDLPHTWNAEDTLAGKEYRRDASWYIRPLTLTPEEISQRVYLRFKAAGTHALVLINDRRAGEHLGGYTAFTIEITGLVEAGDNRVEVRVSNAPRDDLPPLDIDHNIYGGLYRGVDLIIGPEVGISRTEYGGPGVYVHQEEVSATSATMRARPVIDSRADRAMAIGIVAEVLDSEGRVVSSGSVSAEVPAGRSEHEVRLPPIVAPRLWGPDDPYLYTLRVEVWDDRNLVDTATLSIGIRFFRFDPDEGFTLNGQRFEIRGVNRHQDVYRKGAALSWEDHRRDIRLIREVGANAVRLAHYPQDDAVLELCDSLGLLVWEEIPLVNMITDSVAFNENTLNMLREMVAQHMHHPSVVAWGLANELLIRRQGLVPQKNALVAELHAVAKRMDPARPTAVACHGHTDYARLGMTGIADIVGYNVYFGWYSDTSRDLTRILAGYRDGQRDRPHIISEYGAGSDTRVQRREPSRFDFSEQWQCAMISSYLDQAETLRWLNGTFYWNMFDFGASHRGDTIPGVNQKGLVTFDRQTKKDAFFLVKSRWSSEPVLYLASPRLTVRGGPATQRFEVYTNIDRVTLMHNGRLLPAHAGGVSWDVELGPGENTLVARGEANGRMLSHGYTVTYDPTREPGG